MPQASASASSHLLSRRRVALAIPLLGSALWAATAKASTPVLRTQRPVVGTAVDIVVEGADASLDHWDMRTGLAEWRGI